MLRVSGAVYLLPLYATGKNFTFTGHRNFKALYCSDVFVKVSDTDLHVEGGTLVKLQKVIYNNLFPSDKGKSKVHPCTGTEAL
jgi:hypothetical protein